MSQRSSWAPSCIAQVVATYCVLWMRRMGEKYDRELMKRGMAARQLIEEGEEPFRMLLQAVWPDHDWEESLMLARLMECPTCLGSAPGCKECGSTGLITEERRRLLSIEGLAKLAHESPG